MKPIRLMYLAPAAWLASCTDRPLIYTGSNFGVHAAGMKSEIPEKLNVGYERSEYAWMPRGGASSVRGSYDAEYRYPANIAVSEKLITGPAARQNPMEQDENEEERGKASDLVLSTNTRVNLGIEGAPSDGPGFSFNFGFKRAVLALFPSNSKQSAANNNTADAAPFMGDEGAPYAGMPSSNTEDGELASTYTDLSIHAAGFGKFVNPLGIARQRQLTGSAGGARTVQTIATGRAAKLVAKKELEAQQARRAEQLSRDVAPPTPPLSQPANPPIDDTMPPEGLSDLPNP